jgi:hypothetical protein
MVFYAIRMIIDRACAELVRNKKIAWCNIFLAKWECARGIFDMYGIGENRGYDKKNG